ncbi:unnamed protein product, partial [Discosporangium mesarthrocarpum]
QVLRGKLRKELDRCQANIAQDKAAVMEGTKTSAQAMDLKLKREGELKGRIAAFAVFNKNVEKAQKLGAKLQASKGSDLAIKERCFKLMLKETRSTQQHRAIILNVLLKMGSRLLHAALLKWTTGKHAFQSDSDLNYVVRGIGGRLLINAEVERESIEQELREVMKDTASLRRVFAKASLSNRQRSAMEGSSLYHDTEMGSLIEDSESLGFDLAIMAQGDGFMKDGKEQQAVKCYERQARNLRRLPLQHGLRVLSLVHGRLAQGQMEAGRVDLATISFDRSLELAKESNHRPGVADALEGLAKCYHASSLHREAAAFLKRSLAANAEVKDSRREGRIYRALEEVHRRLGEEEHANMYRERADIVDHEFDARLSKTRANLEDYQVRLVDQTAEISKTVTLERVTAGYMSMCQRRAKIEGGMEDVKTALKAQEKAHSKAERHKADILHQIQDQLVEAQTGDKEVMSSKLIHEGETMAFEIEELKLRLREREVEVGVELGREQDNLTSIKNRLNNHLDELEQLIQDIRIEGGDLMRSVIAKSRLKLIGLNPANTAGNEVDGTATGGMEKVVAAEGRQIMVYDIHDGKLEHVFSGDEPGRHTGEMMGHCGPITALFFYKYTVYSGSMDCTVWNLEDSKRLLVLRGHEATVCAVAADATKIVSGAADKIILIWDPHDGHILRTLHGHSKSVVSLHTGEICASFLISGGADGDVRVWGPGRDKTVEDFGGYVCQRRLASHQHPATCVSYGRLELVSGHEDGTIIVWWATTGLIMMTSRVHRGPVRQLQFDATKVVSCGMDQIVAVTDLTTGEAMMSLRGHTGDVLGIAFDAKKIISASDDGTLRTWVWGARGARQDKYEVLDQGDNLGRVAKKHGTTVADILKWNGIRDTRQIGAGVRLIVKKGGNPNEPTAAELEAAKLEEVAKRRAQTVVRSRERDREDHKVAGNALRPRGILRTTNDSSSLISRIGKANARFGELWQEAKR